MKLIKLAQGQFAQVDDADFAWLNQWEWRAQWCKRGKCYYAVRGECRGTVYMRRAILGLEYGDPRRGDHVEPSETLNNTSDNLRIAKNGIESNANTRKHVDNTSGFKGVTKRSDANTNMARIQVNGKPKHLGSRPSREEAHALYAQTAQELFGTFARAA